MKLAELQQHFWDTVRQRGAPPAELDRSYRGTHDLSATERMRIYHLAYWGRQVRVLADSFPELHALLGEAAFTRTALRYLTARPSRGPRIEDIAPGFATFLSALDPSFEMAAHVARLEGAALQALIAADPRQLASATEVNPARFASTTLTFVESLKVIEVRCDALARVAPELAGPALLSTAESAKVAIWRKRFAVRRCVLDAPEFLAYELASRGQSIAKICAALYEERPQAVAERAGRMLSRWLAREWITHFVDGNG
ncbi:MAG TPA: DNA-binding domain-containing protein [Polyangiaceae bacterium]